MNKPEPAPRRKGRRGRTASELLEAHHGSLLVVAQAGQEVCFSWACRQRTLQIDNYIV
jgi:hypothetical protein